MTNQFTDEQIEAAVKAVANEHAERGDACGPAGFARVARAALEAAAGVAPPAPSEYAYCPTHGDGLGSSNRSDRCASAPSGHEYAAPVQPSSTVDEAAALERVTAERDAAMARIAKAWELHEPFTWSFGYGPVQSCKWCADHGAPQEVASWPCPTIQALEGAPEPEGKPSSTVDEAALIREAKAEAWDEGYWQGINGHTGPGNPYRDCGAAEYREGSET